MHAKNVLCVLLLQVTFQTVLVKPVMSEDGKVEEQAAGFKGAFLHGIGPIAPDVETDTGMKCYSRYYTRLLLGSIYYMVCRPFGSGSDFLLAGRMVHLVQKYKHAAKHEFRLN